MQGLSERIAMDVSDSRGAQPFTGRHLGYLMVFTVAAAVLRLWSLGEWSFWVDEAHTFRDVTMSEAKFWESGTSRYPLSFLLLRWLAEYFSLGPEDLTESIMRLPFAFFGIASVPAIAVVGRALVGRRSALLAAMFLAFSPWHIYWSQNARSYSMVLFLCLMAMGAAFHGYQKRSWPLLFVALLLFFLGGFSHPSGYLSLTSALLYFLIVIWFQRDADSVFAKWGPVAILGILAVIAIISLPILAKSLEVKSQEFSLFHLIQTVAFYVGVPVIVAAIGGALVLFDRGARAGMFLACMAVLPLLALAILSSVGMQKLSAQYAFATLPAIYILAAVFVISLASVFTGPGLRNLVLRLVPLAMVVGHMLGQDFLYFAKEYGWRPRWKEAVRYIQLHANEHDHKGLVVLTTNAPSVGYYFDPGNVHGGPTPAPEAVHVISLETWSLYPEKRPGEPQLYPDDYLRGMVESARTSGRDLWVVVTEPGLQEKDRQARANTFIRTGLRQVRRLPNWTGPKDMVVLVYHLE